MDPLTPFCSVWLVDFEFRQPDGERPEPLCMVAREFYTGATIRLWQSALVDRSGPPFPIGDDSLFIAYFASAELSCFLALDWSMPARILDLFVEFRNLTNGLSTPCGAGLLGALAYFGIDGIETAEKKSMRELAQRGGPYTAEESAALLDYCESDVNALEKLLPAMLPRIDVPRALLRGRYMAAVARMERTGIPIDTEALADLEANWKPIQSRLIERIDADVGVYVPTDSKLLPAAIIEMAAREGIDPLDLAEAAGAIFEAKQAAGADRAKAVDAARKAIGLNPGGISRWQNNGKDAATRPALDAKARALAGEYPALGIGPGFDIDAGRLWELLSDPPRVPRSRTDPEVLREAFELIGESGRHRFRTDRPMSFSAERFAGWLARNGIPWPRLESGALDLSEDTFREMARAYPAVAPLRELRHSLSQLRLSDLAVGSDGRNRCLLSPFQARTGRNQPSNSKYIFGPSCWLRALIQPGPNRAVAYIDFEQQEFAIAAALSKDAAMMDAYRSGDPYLAFAKQAGDVPPNGTKQTHRTERELFKTCILAVQYGMGGKSLAQRIGQSEAHARRLLRLHRECFPSYWRWSQAAVDHAMLRGWLQTAFGWTIQVGMEANPRSLANFPVQGNGAEMLRLACSLCTEAGIEVCAPIHDAVLIEADADDIDDAVARTECLMREASRIVLDGFEVRTEAKIVRHPDRYIDPRGEKFWATVCGILDELEMARQPVPDRDTFADDDLSQIGTSTCPELGHPVHSYPYSYSSKGRVQ